MLRRLLLVAALLPAAARSQDACSDAVARLCPASRGDVLLASCLRAHEADLRKACPGNLEKVLAKARSLASACDGDVRSLCKGVEPGDGRVAQCLKSHEHQLSQSCQGAFNEWRLGRMQLTAACAGDVGKFCSMVPEGAGRIWTCLKENEANLTSDCRSAVNKL